MNTGIDTLAGATVLVTGAAMEMGARYAGLAVKDHAGHVILWDINAEALGATANELRGCGSEIHTQVVDVSRLESIEEAAREVRSGPGAPDILINNAGIVRGNYFWEHDQRSDIAATMNINTLALVHISREFLPAMIERRRTSRIVNVASAAGLLTNPRMSIYSASKWAVVGSSDSLRLELAQAGHKHIKVTTFCPSCIKTGMFAGARGPLLTPLLEPGPVTERVWRAMKEGTPMLMMP